MPADHQTKSGAQTAACTSTTWKVTTPTKDPEAPSNTRHGDKTAMATCKESELPRERQPSKSARTDVTDTIVYNPVVNCRVTTAYTSGDGGDNWKGCAK